MNRIVAIVLSGGKGKRMNMDIPKQYMDIHGYPLIYYTLKTFEKSKVDEIILVASDIEYCKEQIVEKYGLRKVKKIVEAGNERYDSVYNGLCAIGKCDYVLIHDGARACITDEIINDAINNVEVYKTAIAAVKVKDTIKMCDENGIVIETFDRNKLWQIQTPQAFEYKEIKEAYEKMYKEGTTLGITDDAMVMEKYGKISVKLFMADYNNIKVTTQEDIKVVEKILENYE